MKEITIFKGSRFYKQFLQSFSKPSKTPPLDLHSDKITQALFFHGYQVWSAEHSMTKSFNLRVHHNLSDFLRDLVSFYLNIALGPGFETYLEEKKNKVQPDIIIKHRGRNIFAIEIKTTIGYERSAPKKSWPKRIAAIAKTFKIPKKNVIYLLLSPQNVTAGFESRFWDREKERPRGRPTEFPYSQTFPLFYNRPDPKYLTRNGNTQEGGFWSTKRILEEARKNTICTLESIIRRIKLAAKGY